MINIRLFVSEKVGHQIFTSNTSIAYRSKGKTSNLKPRLRDSVVIFQTDLVYREKIVQVFLQRSVSKWRIFTFLWNVFIGFDFFRSFLIGKWNWLLVDPFWCWTFCIFFQFLQGGWKQTGFIEHKVISERLLSTIALMTLMMLTIAFFVWLIHCWL